MNARSATLFLGCLCLLTLTGCGVKTSVRVGAGPSFHFNGTGRLFSFRIYGPRPGHKIATPVDDQSVTWSIETVPSAPYGAWVSGMEIEYGKVPKGYVQMVPNGSAARPLTIGQVYIFYAETTGAPGASGFIYVSQNGPVQINVPNLCGNSSASDRRPVKCGTADPYVEPRDLGKFARENKVN